MYSSELREFGRFYVVSDFLYLFIEGIFYVFIHINGNKMSTVYTTSIICVRKVDHFSLVAPEVWTTGENGRITERRREPRGMRQFRIPIRFRFSHNY